MGNYWQQPVGFGTVNNNSDNQVLISPRTAAMAGLAIRGTQNGTQTGSLFVCENESGTSLLSISSAGVLATSQAITPATSDAAALGSASLMWSDLYLASGGTINFNNGDVAIIHSANSLAFSGATGDYTFDDSVTPAANDGGALGSSTLMWSDLYLASGAVVNFNNGDVTLTHGANICTVAGGTFSVGTFASAASGSGIALGTLTKALDVCSDDGAAALTAGSYQSARIRMLVTNAITTGDISINGGLGHTKVVANVASSGWVSGMRGYVECSSASISSAAGVRGMIDVPAGSTIADGAIAAAFQADSNDLGGTHTGKAAAIHIPNPVAGTWDYALVLGTTTGVHDATAGTYSTADGYIKIRVGASDMRIPYFAGTD